MKYILVDRVAVPADLLRWAQWFETADRVVAQEEVEGYFVSTVFLGIDHAWGDGERKLFETMVFTQAGKGDECYQDRYPTWERAELGHRDAVAQVKAGTIRAKAQEGRDE